MQPKCRLSSLGQRQPVIDASSTPSCDGSLSCAGPPLARAQKHHLSSKGGFEKAHTGSLAVDRRNLTALAAKAPFALVADVDARACRLFVLGVVDEALLDVGCEAVKGLVDVDVALCRDFEEGDAELVGKSLALFLGDYALLLPVALVADEDLVDALGGMLLDILEPGANVCERVRWRQPWGLRRGFASTCFEDSIGRRLGFDGGRGREERGTYY